jgi:dihydroxyacetone kinase
MISCESDYDSDDDDNIKSVCVQDIIYASREVPKLKKQLEFAENHLNTILRRVNDDHAHTSDEAYNRRKVFLTKILPSVAATALSHGVDRDDSAKASDIAINSLLSEYNLSTKSEVAHKRARSRYGGMYD